jgi:hypothetical protein
MISRRLSVIIIVALTLGAPLVLAAGASGAALAGQQPVGQDNGPAFGNWKYTGKDKAGVVWTGTLVIEKLDPQQFNPQKYIAVGDIRSENPDGSSGKGLRAAIQYDPATRVVMIGEDSDYGGAVYTAVLSPDGKTLSNGVWRETERGSDEKEKLVTSEGEWSATRVEQ